MLHIFTLLSNIVTEQATTADPHPRQPRCATARLSSRPEARRVTSLILFAVVYSCVRASCYLLNDKIQHGLTRDLNRPANCTAANPLTPPMNPVPSGTYSQEHRAGCPQPVAPGRRDPRPTCIPGSDPVGLRTSDFGSGFLSVMSIPSLDLNATWFRPRGVLFTGTPCWTASTRRRCAASFHPQGRAPAIMINAIGGLGRQRSVAGDGAVRCSPPSRPCTPRCSADSTWRLCSCGGVDLPGVPSSSAASTDRWWRQIWTWALPGSVLSSFLIGWPWQHCVGCRLTGARVCRHVHRSAPPYALLLGATTVRCS